MDQEQRKNVEELIAAFRTGEFGDGRFAFLEDRLKQHGEVGKNMIFRAGAALLVIKRHTIREYGGLEDRRISKITMDALLEEMTGTQLGLDLPKREQAFESLLKHVEDNVHPSLAAFKLTA